MIRRLIQTLARPVLLCFALSSQALPGASFPQLHEVLQDVTPAVAHLRTNQPPRSMSQLNDPSRYFFQNPSPLPNGYVPLGTAFLIQKGSYALTAYRNLAGIENLEIVLRNKKSFKARLLGADRTNDLALLKIDTSKALPSLEFADSQRAQVGDPIAIVGLPLGFEPVVSQGHLAAKGGVTGRGANDDLWLFDVATHPGNAGGPIVDRRGRVVGIALAGPQNQTVFGLGLPSKRVETLVKYLQKDGKILRAWVGIVARSLPQTEGLSMEKGEALNQGIQIENLIIDGPAAKAGLQIGDLLVSAATTPLRSITDLRSILEQNKPGTNVRMKVYRRQKSFFEVEVTLSEIPSAEDLPDAQDLL